MLNDINRFAIVLNVEVGRVCGNGNLLDRVCRGSCAKSHNLVVGVDQEFVNELVEARIESDGLLSECVSVSQEDCVFGVCDAADVGIGKRENVLAMSLLLIGG